MRSIRFGLIAIALCGVIALAAGIEVALWAQQGEAISLSQELTGNLADSLRLALSELDLRQRQQFRAIYQWSTLAVLTVDLLVVIGLVSLSLSIRRLREQQREQTHQAMHDPLTGLPNRRYLGEWLTMALAAAHRRDRPLALLYIDLDGFKSINDRFGHEVGDRVLQRTASRLRGALRASDFFARLGGDEFVAVLAEAPNGSPLPAIVERLQTVIMKAPIAEIDDGEIRASVGAAWYPEDGDSIEALLAAADRAMYEVKQTHHLAAPLAAPAVAAPREIVIGERRSAG